MVSLDSLLRLEDGVFVLDSATFNLLVADFIVLIFLFDVIALPIRRVHSLLLVCPF